MLTDFPSDVVPTSGLPQHHKPFVHATTVFPTPNPFDLLSRILLSKYDFPVLYKPATDITPMGPDMLFNKDIAYWVSWYSNIDKIVLLVSGLTTTKGIGFYW